MNINDLSSIEAQKLMEIVADPVKWSQVFVRTYDRENGKYVPWVARWYQVEMLRDESVRKVARCGRRTGKCLPPWVKIFDPTNGDRVPIGELYKRQSANVLTMHEDFKVLPTTTDIVIDNGIKEVFKVELDSGRGIDATGNHPLYTVDGWKNIDELSVGDYVAVPRALPHFGNENVSDEEVAKAAHSLRQGVPDFVFRLNKRKTMLFISELYGKDGPTHNYETHSRETAEDIQHLLLKLGINLSLVEKENPAGNSYILISIDNTEASKMNARVDISNNPVSKETYEQLDGDISWERIRSIRSIGDHQTYDLTIPETHNFVANDIIVHNTETMCIDMLHRTNKNNNYRCLVATPYENQVRLIFSRLKELIESSPLLKSEVKRLTSNPFVIEWKNGSSIYGFTTGAASGSGGASIRGQRAD